MRKVYIGYDAIDHNACEVAERSLIRHSSIPLKTIRLKHWELRRQGIYWRSYHTDGRGQRWDDEDGKPFSTDFSFTRFCIPLLEEYKNEWVLFVDADMMFTGDVKELFDLVDDTKSVMCVKHDHRPPEYIKMGGLIQTQYFRKNWSSVVLWNPSKNRALTKYVVNNQSGQYLHKFSWLTDEEIGALPEEWNWLEGYSNPEMRPKLIHYTRGTPDMPGTEDAYMADKWWSYLRDSQTCAA